MEAFKLIEQSRQQDRNPFREMLERMGAFGGPTMQDMLPPGAPTVPRSNLGGATQQTASGGSALQQLVAELVAQGMPQAEAVRQAQQIMTQQGR